MDKVSKDEAEGLARELVEEIGKQVARAVVEVLGTPETRQALAHALQAAAKDELPDNGKGNSQDAADATSSRAGQSKPVCREPGCNRPARARGLCSKHYQRLRYREKRAAGNGKSEPGSGVPRRGVGLCEAEGCDQPVYARNMCSKHFMEWVRSRRKS